MKFYNLIIHIFSILTTGLPKDTKTLQTCVWRGFKIWQGSTLREGTTLRLPTVWSTAPHWLQSTSTCWRIVAICQLVVSHFRSVHSPFKKDYLLARHILYLPEVKHKPSSLTSLCSDFSVFPIEYLIQRVRGVSSIRWRPVSRGGGDLCWEVLQWIWPGWPPGASSCLF